MSAASSYAIPTVATVRPCSEIAPEALSGDALFSTVADRYAALTTKLPLAGGGGMLPTAAGGMALIEYLHASAPWLGPAIAGIERQLRVQAWAGRPWLAWRPMLLSGPPGTGKSHLAQLIAGFAGTGCGTLDLGGSSDSRTLEGTARGWTNAQPCWPAVMMSQTMTANPILVLEEVDKAGGSRQGGTPHNVLLTMIERETATEYWDKCLLAKIDLSHVCWLMTCNDPSTLPVTLLSRLDVVEIDGPTVEHFDLLVLSMTAALARTWNVPVTSMPTLPGPALDALEKAFAQSRSARRLRRHLESVFATLVPFAGRPTQ